jgi:hypothetical protein
MARLASLALVAAVVGVVMGCAGPAPAPVNSSNVTMHTGRADAGETAISVEADGWTYAIPTDVFWVDGEGVGHDGGRPNCLDPGESSLVRFASVDATVEGTSWRPVVWVACPG